MIPPKLGHKQPGHGWPVSWLTELKEHNQGAEGGGAMGWAGPPWAGPWVGGVMARAGIPGFRGSLSQHLAETAQVSSTPPTDLPPRRRDWQAGWGLHAQGRTVHGSGCGDGPPLLPKRIGRALLSAQGTPRSLGTMAL